MRWWPWRNRAQPSPAIRKRRYDAAHAPWAAAWQVSGADARQEVAADLATLRDRARDLVRNRAYARRIVDALADHLVGPGVAPTVATGELKSKSRQGGFNLTKAHRVMCAKVSFTNEHPM